MFSGSFVNNAKSSSLLLALPVSALVFALAAYYFKSKGSDKRKDPSPKSVDGLLLREEAQEKETFLAKTSDNTRDVVLAEKEEEKGVPTDGVTEELSIEERKRPVASSNTIEHREEESSSEDKNSIEGEVRTNGEGGIKIHHDDDDDKFEEDEDEEENSSPLSSSLCNLRLTPESRPETANSSRVNGTPSDRGLGSSLCENGNPNNEEVGSSSNYSDSGGGSGVGDLQPPNGGGVSNGNSDDDGVILAYHFFFPKRLCGPFIGKHGACIGALKSETKCQIFIKDVYRFNSNSGKSRQNYGKRTPQLCIIEGTRSGIEKCLDIVRNKFAEASDISFEQVNVPGNTLWSADSGPSLSLIPKTMNEVRVSAIVTPSQVFCQQQRHPSFVALPRLNECMYHTYNELLTPELPRPVAPGTVCVGQSSGFWWRAQVMSYDQWTDTCEVKYLDYGGFETLPANMLKQIRSDFLSLPFQAVQCYLANVEPKNENGMWPDNSTLDLEDILYEKFLTANLVGVADDGIPLIQLYAKDSEGEEFNVNSRLVEIGLAKWSEHTPIESDSQ